jgi:hypothetical protein
LAKRSLLDRIIGSGERERKRRKDIALQTVSWSFVAIVAIFVILLASEFISRTFLSHPVSGELDKADMLVRKGERIQINVLNGSGHQHIAQRFTDYLRARKFDVVHTDNYSDTNVKRSFLIDRVGDSVSSQKIAYALGISDSLVRREIDTEEYVKADLIIGKDFQLLNPMK